MRNWDIDKIKSSNISVEMKQVITQEYNSDTLSNLDPNNFSERIITLKDLKKRFKNAEKFLYYHLRDDYFKTKYLYQLYNYTAVMPYDFEHINITDEDLIERTLDFYSSLNDKEILDRIKYLLDEKNGLVRIEKHDPNNPICNEVKGRCIKSLTSNDVFMSYYMKGTSEDLQIFTHETGHMLSHSLFGQNINFFIQNFFSETESYLFESLMVSYIANKLNLPDLALHLEANRTAKIIDIIWNIRVIDILGHQFGNKPNIKALNKRLNKDGLLVKYTEDDFKEIATFTYYELNSILHSYLIALHFYKETLTDQEKGLYLFKKFATSKDENISELLKNNEINIEESISYLDTMYFKAQTLKKRHTEV